MPAMLAHAQQKNCSLLVLVHVLEEQHLVVYFHQVFFTALQQLKMIYIRYARHT